jgi:gas vesicle protein
MNKFLAFLAGCGAGAVTALLLAPRTGEEMRDAISSKVRENYDAVSEQIESQGGIRGIVDKGIERGKDIAEVGRRRVNETIGRGRARIQESIEAGRDTYWEQKRDLGT